MKYLPLVFALALVGCGKKEEPPAPPSVQTAAAPTQTDGSPSVDQALDAVTRDPAVDKACYDSPRDGWYIHYREPKEAGPKSGWYYVQLSFYSIPLNKSWYTQEMNADKYTKVWPDTTGLPCKEVQ